MANCGPACTFCGKCGKTVPKVKPPDVAPPGFSASNESDKESCDTDKNKLQHASSSAIPDTE